MKRLNPLGSRLGMLLTMLLFIGLGASLWINRGLAFSPGKVTAKSQQGVKLEGFGSHADFEKQCGKCHDPLRTNLATKCLQCHIEELGQIQGRQGAHGQMDAYNECSTCHPEHRGRNFDPTLASFNIFDHSKTSFSLVRHQANYDTTPMQCAQCHAGTDFDSVDNKTCNSCHAQQDRTFSQAHEVDYGSDCLGCHDGVDRMENFNHQVNGFTLDGKHAQVECKGCHNSVNVQDASSVCSNCHPEPMIHQGLFAQACDTCHSPQGWSPATFDTRPFSHLETAGFSLERHAVNYNNQVITCTTCHPNDLQAVDMQGCVDCHDAHDEVFMADHTLQYGSNCLTCHDGVDRLSNFDHANFFPLEGKHAALQCTDCHTGQVFRGTPSECSQCHKEPEIHAGIFGIKCQYCHTTEAWSPASLREHRFPLNHGLQDTTSQLKCETCHAANYVDYTCYSCHDHQPVDMIQTHKVEGISDQELPDCFRCHPDGASASQ